MVSVDVKHYEIKKESCSVCRVQELCRGGRPGLLVPNKPDSLCGRKATLKKNVALSESRRDQEQGGGAGLSRKPRRDQEQGGGAGLSGEIKSREVELDSQERSRAGRWSWTLKRTQERSRTGRRSWALVVGWFNCLAAELFLNCCISDTVFVTLLRTALETAISEVHRLLRTGGVRLHLLNIVVLAVAIGLFGLCE